jgi:translation elongation factor EF-4
VATEACACLQAEGKKRMKAIGKVNVPQEAFRAVLAIRNSDADSD